MTKKITLTVFVLLFFFFQNFAQTNAPSGKAEWVPIHLIASCGNTINGVEASYQLSTCNGVDIVFVKLVNHNAYPVKVEWYPAVFTQEHQWIKKETLADKKSITLNPNGQLEGDCSGTKPEMIIRLADFSIKKNNFFRYGALSFMVSKQ